MDGWAISGAGTSDPRYQESSRRTELRDKLIIRHGIHGASMITHTFQILPSVGAKKEKILTELSERRAAEGISMEA